MFGKAISKKDEVHNTIIEYNIKHYSASEETPCGMGKHLHAATGPYSTSDFCDRILECSLMKEDKHNVIFKRFMKYWNI